MRFDAFDSLAGVFAEGNTRGGPCPGRTVYTGRERICNYGIVQRASMDIAGACSATGAPPAYLLRSNSTPVCTAGAVGPRPDDNSCHSRCRSRLVSSPHCSCRFLSVVAQLRLSFGKQAGAMEVLGVGMTYPFQVAPAYSVLRLSPEIWPKISPSDLLAQPRQFSTGRQRHGHTSLSHAASEARQKLTGFFRAFCRWLIVPCHTLCLPAEPNRLGKYAHWI